MTTSLPDAPWVGREMLRQVELRLAAQAAALTALEARAASLINLAGAGTLALGAAAASAPQPLAMGAAVAAGALLTAALLLFLALRASPRWGTVGLSATTVAAYDGHDQDASLRVMAAFLDQGRLGNTARLNSLAGALAWGCRLILFAPALGGLVALAAR